MAYKKTEHYDEDVTEGLIKNYREAIKLIGEDPDREGLLKTPERLAKAMQYCTQGYSMDAREILNSAKFHEEGSEMIIVKNIELYSMCEHHMIPFFWESTHCLYSQWMDYRIKQTGEGCRCLCEKITGPGKIDHSNIKRNTGNFKSLGRSGCNRGRTLMYDDARSSKTKFCYHYFSIFRRI
jgi:hypothetical protein